MYTSFCSSTPSASGDITHKGFRDTLGQIFWYSTLEDMYYMYSVSSRQLTYVLLLKACSRKNIPVYLRLYSIGADYLPLISLN